MEKIFPFYNTSNTVPIVLITSDKYAPYCGVLLSSIIYHQNSEYNYDIVVLSKDMTEHNQTLIIDMANGFMNISIRVFLLGEYIKMFNTFHPFGHLSIDSALKLLLFSELFDQYDKIVNTDVDLIFEHDIAEMYNEYNMSDTYIAASNDVIMMNFCYRNCCVHKGIFDKDILVKTYLRENLGIDSPDKYLNTGVCIINLKKCRENNKYNEILSNIAVRKYWFMEQCAMNDALAEKSCLIDAKWNVLMINDNDKESISKLFTKHQYSAWQKAYNNPYVIHFAGGIKPWNKSNIENSDRFYFYARFTPWYEKILINVSINSCNELQNARKIDQVNRKVNEVNMKVLNLAPKVKEAHKIATQSTAVKLFAPFNSLRSKILLKMFPKNTRRREFIKSLVFKNMRPKLYHYIFSELRSYYIRFQSKFPFTKAHKWISDIHLLKNKYEGQRCFIVGLGPSLTISDLKMLSNEVTFSLNNVFKLFELTDWRPTFYFLQEIMLLQGQAEYEKFAPQLNKYKMKAFLPICKYSKELENVCKSCYFFPIVEDWSNYIREYTKLKFSFECDKVVNAAFTSIYSIFQIAIYMGFKEIYLLGTDCNYTGDFRHCYQSSDDVFDKKRNMDDNDSVLNGFRAIKRVVDCLPSVNVYNATRGGNLEYFPRVQLEEILQTSNHYIKESN